MSKEIDERVVQMRFENEQFERGVKTTMGTVDKLKRSLDFGDAAAQSVGLFQNALNALNFSTVLDGSAAMIAKFTIISNIVTDLQNKATNLVKSFTIEPVKAGWSKYAEITKSTQTIMSATADDYENEADQIEDVNYQLDRLQWFADETSYSLTDMTNNIGKFTSAGVKLGQATSAMMGISTWAAQSGAGIGEASRAMYNLSQAMGMGSVRTQDWMSIENANMATKQFKQQVIEAAIAMGELERREDGVYITGTKAAVSAENFRENLKEGWFTSDVLLKALSKYSDFADLLYLNQNELYESGMKDITTSKYLEYVDRYVESAEEAKKVIDEISKETGLTADILINRFDVISGEYKDIGGKAFRAAQEAKTFTEAIEATQDAVSSGWATTFRTIFGDYKEAKVIWTNLANELWDVFAGPGERRNAILDVWKEAGGRDSLFNSIGNLWDPIKNTLELFREAKADFFSEDELGNSLANLFKNLENFTANFKMSDETLEKMKSTMDSLVRLFYPIQELIGSILKGLKPLTKMIGITFDTVFHVVHDVFDVLANIPEILRENLDIYNTITKFISKYSNKIVKIYSKVSELIKRITNSLTTALTFVEKGFVRYLKLGDSVWKALYKSIWSGLNRLVPSLASLFNELFGTSFDPVEVLDKVITFRKNLELNFSKIKDQLLAFKDTVKNVFVTNGGGVTGFISAATFSIGSVLRTMFHKLSEITGVEAFGKIGDSIFTFFENAKTVLLNAWSVVSKYVDPIIDKISEFVSPIVTPVWNAIQNLIHWFVGDSEDPDAELDEAEETIGKVETVLADFKSAKDLALEIIRGDWGNGEERDRRLAEAGYNNDLVQGVVNQVWSLAGAWKEGYQEILDSYADVDARLEGGPAGDKKEFEKEQKGVRLSFKKTAKVMTLLDKAAGSIAESYNNAMGDEKKQKKTLTFLQKQHKLAKSGIDAISETEKVEPPKSLLDWVKISSNKFLAYLPTLFTNIGKTVAWLVVKIKELGSTINTKFGAALTKVINFYKKHEEDIKYFITTLKTKIVELGTSIWNGLGVAWEKVKSIFEGTSPSIEKFFTSLMHFDLKGMGDAVFEFFETIGSNISGGVEKAIELAREAGGKLGGIFGNIFNTVIGLFGGGEETEAVEASEDAETETAELADQSEEAAANTANAANGFASLSEAVSDIGESLSKGEMPSADIFDKAKKGIFGILDIASKGTSILTLFRTGGAIKKAGNLLDSISDLLGGEDGGLLGKIKGKLFGGNDLWGTLKSFAKIRYRRDMGQQIKDVAESILMIAGVIAGFGLFEAYDPNVIDNGLAIFDRMLQSVSLFIGVLTGSQLIKKLSNGLQTVEDTGKGFSMDKLDNIGTTIFALAAAVYVAYLAVSSFANLYKTDSNSLYTGVAEFTLILTELGGVIAAFEWVNAKGGLGGQFILKGVASTILALAEAVRIIIQAISDIVTLANDTDDKGVLMNAFGGVTAILVELTAVVSALEWLASASNGTVVIKAGGMIMAIGFAMILLAAAVGILASVGTNMWSAVLALGFLMVILGIMVGVLEGINAFSKSGDEVKSKSGGTIKTIVLLIVMAGLLAGLIYTLSECPFEQSFGQLAGLAIVIGVLGGIIDSFAGVAKLINNWWSVGGIVELVGAFGAMLSQVLWVFTKYKDVNLGPFTAAAIAVVVGALGGIVTAFGAVSALMSGGKGWAALDVAELVGAFGVMFTQIMYVLNKYPVKIDKSTAGAIETVVTALGTLVTVFGGLGGVLGPSGALGIFFGGVAGGIATAAFGEGIGLALQNIVTFLEEISAMDNRIEIESNGQRGILALKTKVVDVIVDIGKGIGTAIDEITKIMTKQDDLESANTAANTLASLFSTLASMYGDTSQFDLFMEWISSVDPTGLAPLSKYKTKGEYLADGLKDIGKAFAALSTSMQDVKISDVDKTKALVPVLGAINTLFTDPGMLTELGWRLEALTGLMNVVGSMDITHLSTFNEALNGMNLIFTNIPSNFDSGWDPDAEANALVGMSSTLVEKFAKSVSSEETKTKLEEATKTFMTNLSTAFDNNKELAEKIAKNIPAWIADPIATMTVVMQYFYDAASNFLNLLDKAFNSYQMTPKNTGKNIAGWVAEGINNHSDVLFQSGVNAVQGIINGLRSKEFELRATAVSLAGHMTVPLQNRLQEHSPSKVTTKIGAFAALGLINGMLQESGSVENASGSLADLIRSTLANGSDIFVDDIDPTIRPIIDLSDINKSARYVNGMFGSRLVGSLSMDSANSVKMSSLAYKTAFKTTENSNKNIQTVVNSLQGIQNDLNSLGEKVANMQLVMDTGALVGSISTPIDNSLQRRVVYNNRRL